MVGLEQVASPLRVTIGCMSQVLRPHDMQRLVLCSPGGPERTPITELDGGPKHDAPLDPQLEQAIPGKGDGGTQAVLSPGCNGGGQETSGNAVVAVVAVLHHIHGDGESSPLSKLLPARSQLGVKDSVPRISDLYIG